jgi:hypothetical protein
VLAELSVCRCMVTTCAIAMQAKFVVVRGEVAPSGVGMVAMQAVRDDRHSRIGMEHGARRERHTRLASHLGRT